MRAHTYPQLHTHPPGHVHLHVRALSSLASYRAIELPALGGLPGIPNAALQRHMNSASMLASLTRARFHLDVQVPARARGGSTRCALCASGT